MAILRWASGGSDRRTRRFLLAGGRRRAGAVVAGLVLLGAAAPASAQTLTWSVVPSPSPGSDSGLYGVSCVSATACTAAGYDETSGGAVMTLVESWNGTGWSVVPSPSPGTGQNDLDGVSCVSATACTAVGGYSNASSPRGLTLVESWNGTGWSVVPSPNRGTRFSVLYRVSCVSATVCTAVGSWGRRLVTQTLVESWNGIRWSVVPSPNRGTRDNVLYGVSCVSAAACKAVGYYLNPSDGVYRALIESWNGTRWSVAHYPNRGYSSTLRGVSCASATACTAVGNFGAAGGNDRSLVESWNGTRWSVVPSPNRGPGPNDLYGVSCASAASCTAVGTSRDGNSTLIESWNGTSWSVVPSPSPGTGANHDNNLGGVSCASAASCTAAGYYETTSGSATLIESGTAGG